MEKRTKTVLIEHLDTSTNCYYDDEQRIANISSIQAMSLLIARLSACLQYSDDEKEVCTYQIDITKIEPK